LQPSKLLEAAARLRPMHCVWFRPILDAIPKKIQGVTP
jgi:hypothetical protein